MTQPAVIFDFGNVIATFDYRRVVDRLGRGAGRSAPAIQAALDEAGWSDIHQLFEEGRLTTPAFREQWLRRAGIVADPAEFAAAWCDIFTPNDSIGPVLASLHQQGYPLVLGSNTNALQAAYLREQFAPVLSHFQALVFSFEVGRMKPAPEFYQACARAAGRLAADCVFIDDLAANVAGAQALGMRSLLYTTTPTLVADLAQLGITARVDPSGQPEGSPRTSPENGGPRAGGRPPRADPENPNLGQ